MSFQNLIDKVRHAEQSVEAHEKSTAADLRQLRASWRQAWTPGRIVLAGLASGFVLGRSKTLMLAGSSGFFQMAGSVSSALLKAALQTGAAAGLGTEAAAQAVQDTSPPIPTPMPTSAADAENAGASESLRQHHEKLRRDGLV